MPHLPAYAKEACGRRRDGLRPVLPTAGVAQKWGNTHGGAPPPKGWAEMGVETGGNRQHRGFPGVWMDSSVFLPVCGGRGGFAGTCPVHQLMRKGPAGGGGIAPARLLSAVGLRKNGGIPVEVHRPKGMGGNGHGNQREPPTQGISMELSAPRMFVAAGSGGCGGAPRPEACMRRGTASALFLPAAGIAQKRGNAHQVRCPKHGWELA